MNATLTSEQIEQAASRLTAARLAVSTVPDLEPNAPANSSSAYSIASLHAAKLGWDVVGWKVGCTSALAMEILGRPGPFSGRVFEGTVFDSKGLEFGAIDKPLVESEFAFFLGKSLPARDDAYTVEEVMAATKAVAPAFEIVTSRLEGGVKAGVFNIIADSGANGGVVFGEPVPIEQCPPLNEVKVQFSIDGEQIASGSGSDILENPWGSLAWLANHLSARHIGLEAGQFAMSGTCTGVHPLAGGSTAAADFAGIGKVSISRTKSS